MITCTIRAKYRNGVLEPLEAVNLIEDQELLITLNPLDEHGDPLIWSIPQTLPDMYEDTDAFIKAIYQARIDGTSNRPPPTF